MTIVLTPETEMRLKEKALRAGQDVNVLADTLLSDALDDDPDELTEDEIAEIRAGIRRGYKAATEGRERPLSAYIADVQSRRAERKAAR